MIHTCTSVITVPPPNVWEGERERERGRERERERFEEDWVLAICDDAMLLRLNKQGLSWPSSKEKPIIISTAPQKFLSGEKVLGECEIRVWARLPLLFPCVSLLIEHAGEPSTSILMKKAFFLYSVPSLCFGCHLFLTSQYHYHPKFLYVVLFSISSFQAECYHFEFF